MGRWVEIVFPIESTTEEIVNQLAEWINDDKIVESYLIPTQACVCNPKDNPGIEVEIEEYNKRRVRIGKKGKWNPETETTDIVDEPIIITDEMLEHCIDFWKR